MGKRDGKILDIITRDKRVEVTTLSEVLGVSEVTVRKDLDSLQDKGLVVREHGYATLANPSDVGGRLAYNYETKRRIARAAAELVAEDTTIMVESGSCNALLVRELADTKRGITVVTNSAFIAGYVRDSPNVTCVLLGGTYQRDSQVVVGPLLHTCAAEFYANRLFVGADGWVEGVGPTNADQMRADAVRSMAASCGEVTVLTESDKFGRHGAIPMKITDKPMSVVTDSGLPIEWRTKLERDNVRLYLAD